MAKKLVKRDIERLENTGPVVFGTVVGSGTDICAPDVTHVNCTMAETIECGVSNNCVGGPPMTHTGTDVDAEAE